MPVDTKLKRASAVHVGLPWRGLFPIESEVPEELSAEAEAYFARVTIPLANQAAYNTLINTLVDGGIWAKLDALYIFAGPNQDAALENLVQDDYHCTAEDGGIQFAQYRGVLGNGTASYIDTNFNPTTETGTSNYALNSACLGGWFNHDVVSLIAEIGYRTGAGTGDGNGTRVITRATNDTISYRVNSSNTASGTASGTVTTGYGLTAINRSGATTTECYKNGGEIPSSDHTATGLLNETIKIGKTAGASSYTLAECNAAFIGASLSAAEHLAMYNALNTFFDQFGNIHINNFNTGHQAGSCVYRPSDGAWLHRYKPGILIGIGSCTKIVTCVLLYDYVVDLDDLITVNADEADETGSTANLLEGDILSYYDILHGIIMASGNDASKTAARWAGQLFGGAYNEFVTKMNDYVTNDLGLTESSFVSAAGIIADDVSTPHELTILAHEFFSRPLLREISGKASYGMTITGPNARTETVNQAIPMASDPDIIGVKGGTNILRSMVTMFEAANGQEMVIALTGADGTNDDRYTQTREIIDDYINEEFPA
jgi:D-alanyl-D-alanine carboxypeptidase